MLPLLLLHVLAGFQLLRQEAPGVALTGIGYLLGGALGYNGAVGAKEAGLL